MKGLADKVFILAGAGEIATATATRLGEQGAKVVIGDLDIERASHAAEQATHAGGEARAFRFDISDDDAVRELVDSAVTEFGTVNGLVNIAADLSPDNLGRDTDALDVPLEVWHHTLDVNLTGYLLTIRHALPVMLRDGGGPIVNVISAAAYLGEPTRVSYGVSKAALTALTRHVASRWGKEGVRCNAIAPGFVPTESAVHQVSGDEEEAMLQTILEAGLALLRAPRHGRPNDIAAMATFLLSDDGEWITGQSISVDGGLLLR